MLFTAAPKTVPEAEKKVEKTESKKDEVKEPKKNIFGSSSSESVFSKDCKKSEPSSKFAGFKKQGEELEIPSGDSPLK
jgi:hypothetical protein